VYAVRCCFKKQSSPTNCSTVCLTAQALAIQQDLEWLYLLLADDKSDSKLEQFLRTRKSGSLHDGIALSCEQTREFLIASRSHRTSLLNGTLLLADEKRAQKFTLPWLCAQHRKLKWNSIWMKLVKLTCAVRQKVGQSFLHCGQSHVREMKLSSTQKEAAYCFS